MKLNRNWIRPGLSILFAMSFGSGEGAYALDHASTSAFIQSSSMSRWVRHGEHLSLMNSNGKAARVLDAPPWTISSKDELVAKGQGHRSIILAGGDDVVVFTQTLSGGRAWGHVSCIGSHGETKWERGSIWVMGGLAVAEESGAAMFVEFSRTICISDTDPGCLTHLVIVNRKGREIFRSVDCTWIGNLEITRDGRFAKAALDYDVLRPKFHTISGTRIYRLRENSVSERTLPPEKGYPFLRDSGVIEYQDDQKRVREREQLR